MEVVVPYGCAHPRIGTVTGIMGKFCRVRIMSLGKCIKKWDGRISDVEKV